jgi:CBS domain-containing protein
VSSVLLENNILSVPVYDSQKKSFIGLIDTLELLKLNSAEYSRYLKEQKYEELSSLFPSLTESLPLTAGELVQKSQRARSIHIFDGGDTLETVMKALALYQQHRILVRKRTTKEAHPGQQQTQTSQGPQADYYLLSQSDILRWLWNNLDRDPALRERAEKSLQELQLVDPKGLPVLGIPSSSKALEGFALMEFHKVPAVAVLKESRDANSGKLEATLSASDLRGIYREKLIPLLDMNVLEFLKQIGPQLGRQVTVTPQDKLRDCMDKLLSGQVHRAWVLDDQFRPVGVITLTDIIKIFVRKNV